MIYSMVYSVIIGFFFVGPSHSYSVLLPDDIQLVQIDTLDNNIITHTFFGLDKLTDTEYSLSLSIISKKKYNLLAEDAINKYEQDCNCEVEHTEKVNFKNFRGVKYSIPPFAEVRITELVPIYLNRQSMN